MGLAKIWKKIVQTCLMLKMFHSFLEGKRVEVKL